VNLAGWSLTDNPDQPGQWTFPAVSLSPGEYRIVFASGKDRKPTGVGAKLHTNFKLNAVGEYLGLYNLESPRQAVSEFAPQFPEQRNDFSYGWIGSNQWRYFQVPTPGAANGSSTITEILSPPHFSVQRGYFNQPFNLILSTTDPGVEIRYTTNGGEPAGTNGVVYTGPIPITRTTVLRAASFKTNYLPSRVVTHTYLYGLGLSQRSLPGLSIVTATNNLLGPTGIIGIKGGTYVNGPWQPVNPGDYHNPSQQGIAWERPTSAEWIRPQDNEGFQIDCGIRVQGSDWLRPRYTPSSKFSYRLYFRGDYGPGVLDYPWFANSAVQSLDKVVLRAGHNDEVNPFIKDELIRRLFLDTGQVSSHGTFNTLWVNGAYKGYYNTVERIDKDFCQSWHGGSNNWDVIEQFSDPLDGDTVQWNAMRSFINTQDLTVPANYREAGRRLDLTNFVDYLLVNIYPATKDWPGNNWRAGRERVTNGIFRFYVWDAEVSFGDWIAGPSHNVFTDQLNETGEIATLYKSLRKSPEFRLLFADRVHKHLFNGGALVNTNISARFTQLRTIMQPLIPGFNNAILTTWIPQRRTPLLNHLDSVGLLTSSNAPAFSPHGGQVPLGFNLTMSAPSGTVYYTMNGADPRVPFSGGVAPGASTYSGTPLILNSSVTVKARTLAGTNWSALTEAAFQVAELGLPLRITEIMYNPVGGDAYEFVELQNIGSTTIDLSGVSLDGEVSFIFPNGASVPPQGVLVVSSDNNPAAFTARYPGIIVAGRFSGALDNGGGRLLLKDRNGQVIESVDYSDGGGWPAGADGGGASLEIIRANGDPDDPANWRASVPAGSPGVVDTSAPSIPNVRLNEIMADNLSVVPNGGFFPDWIELHNASAAMTDISDWSLSDGGNPRKFVFPPGTSIAAGGFLVVWCDGLTNAPGLHAPFSLDRSGETVTLFDPSTNRVDAVTFGIQVPDLTVGRDATGAWTLTAPTPGATNSEVALEPQSNLALNEWMANPRPGEDDWIELYNRSTSAPVSLKGIYFATSNALFQVRSLSFIAPGGFALFKADEQTGPNHLDFKLPPSANAIRLSDATGALIDQLTYGAQSEGVSQGRLPDGSATIASFPASPSPEASNYLSVWSGPVLNEIMARNRDAVQAPWGEAADWIEIANLTTSGADLSGLSLSVGSPEPGQWTFPSGAQLASGAHLLIWCDGSRGVSTQSSAGLNLGRALSAEGGAVYLFNAGGQIVDSVEYGFQVENLSIGRVSGGGWTLLATPTPGAVNAGNLAMGSPSDLRLNEWMANPGSGNDWFEIYNTNTLPVALTGLYLTDDPSIVGQTNFVVGPLSFIGGRSWVKWTADGNASQGRDHVNFNLDGLGETLRIYNGFSIVDSVDIYPQTLGVSQGRLPDGASMVVNFPTTPTPEASNYLPLANVVVNEVLSHTDPPIEDAIEFYNPIPTAVDISGWYLSNSQNDFKKYRVTDGTVIPAGGYKVIYENQFNGGVGSVAPFTFNSAHGDAAYLSAVDGAGNLTGYRAQIVFGAAANGVSFGRYVTSVSEDFVAMSRRTFGMDGPGSIAEFRVGSGKGNAYPLVGPVIINEIMYHPVMMVGTNTVENEEEEFIELRNLTTAPVPLYDSVHPTNTWKLSGGVDYTFPMNVTLSAGSYLLLVNFDPATNTAALSAFRGKYGVSTNVPLFGPYGGKLANGEESIELLKPDSPQLPSHPDAGFVPFVLVERINYSNVAPWPTNADGGGESLQRIRVADYGNDPVNWLAATPTPGFENLGAVGDSDGDRMPTAWESANGLDPNDPTDAFQDDDADGQSNLDEYLSGTDPGDASSVLRIDSVTQTAGGLALRFEAVAGKTYAVQYCDSLNGGWIKLLDVDAQSATGTMEVIDPGGPTDARYYRLVTPGRQ
jgi:hypothetical protein